MAFCQAAWLPPLRWLSRFPWCKHRASSWLWCVYLKTRLSDTLILSCSCRQVQSCTRSVFLGRWRAGTDTGIRQILVCNMYEDTMVHTQTQKVIKNMLWEQEIIPQRLGTVSMDNPKHELLSESRAWWRCFEITIIKVYFPTLSNMRS